MKQKINQRLIAISLLAVMILTVLITFVYYGLLREQVRHDLKTEARLLSEAGMSSLVEHADNLQNEDLRITWIDKDGTVIFDNNADKNTLGNHLNRPEVKEALESGSGESIRESDTMNMKTFYYALRMEDGTVIRVATDTRSLLNLFISVIPVIIIVVLIVVVLCAFISHLLTRQLLKPINYMAENLDNTQFSPGYTELQPFLNRIREQHDDIIAAAKSRQDFTANVSHELKTPIAAISGYAELIENKMVDENTQIKFAGDIRKNADRLLMQVNDIIRLSELDHTEVMREVETVDLYKLCENRIELLKQNAAPKNIRINLHGISCEIMANPSMMIELVDNLIQNAIRYNVQDGRVDIFVTKVDNKAKFVVSDTGIGIPPSDIGRIFERFYRVDKSRSRATGGTGLGLAIVKHIVELHDGTITVKSEEGKGTTFTVIL